MWSKLFRKSVEFYSQKQAFSLYSQRYNILVRFSVNELADSLMNHRQQVVQTKVVLFPFSSVRRLRLVTYCPHSILHGVHLLSEKNKEKPARRNSNRPRLGLWAASGLGEESVLGKSPDQSVFQRGNWPEKRAGSLANSFATITIVWMT